GGRRALGFEFLKPKRTGRVVVEAEELELTVPGRTLLHEASLAIERGEHISLVGPNGAGKTTLLEALLGRREPAAGRIRLGHDVPTNRLDLGSREALEAALDAFPGAVLLVTHDRALLDAVSGRLLAIEGTDLVSYPGGWAEYRERSAPEAEPPPPPKAKTRRRTEKKQEQSPLELVEREIERGEGRVAELERQLAEDWTNVDLVTAHRAARDDLAALLAR